MHMTTWLVIFFGGNYTKTQSTKNRQRQLRRDTSTSKHEDDASDNNKKCSIIIDNVVVNISCAFLAYNYGHTLGIEQSIKSAVRLLSYREGRMLGNLSAIW